MVRAKVWSQNIFLAIDGPGGFEVEHRVERIAWVAVLLEYSVPELGPLVDKHVSGGTKVVHHAGVDIQQEVLGDLDVRSLVSTSSRLWSEGTVSVQTVRSINADLGVVEHVSVRHVSVHVGPRGGDQDVDRPDVGPAT